MKKPFNKVIALIIAALSVYFLVMPGVNAYFATPPWLPIELEAHPEYQNSLGEITAVEQIQEQYSDISAYGRQQLEVRYSYTCAFEVESERVVVNWEEGAKGWTDLNDEFFAAKHALGDTLRMYFPENAPSQAEPRNFHFEEVGVAQLESARQNRITFGLVGLVLSLLCLAFLVRGVRSKP